MRLTPGVLRKIGENEELAARVRPTCRFDDRAGLAVSLIELAIPAECIGLEDAGIGGQMGLRVCQELDISRATLYRYVGPDGALRGHALKALES